MISTLNSKNFNSIDYLDIPSQEHVEMDAVQELLKFVKQIVDALQSLNHLNLILKSLNNRD